MRGQSKTRRKSASSPTTIYRAFSFAVKDAGFTGVSRYAMRWWCLSRARDIVEKIPHQGLSMSRFLTVDPSGLPKPVLLWEERDAGAPQIVGRFASLEDVPDAEEMEIWRFDRPLTTAKNGPVNGGNCPVVDAEGAPLWSGARISFRVATHHVNSAAGKGAFVKAGPFGGAEFVSDQPMNVYDRSFVVARRREQFSAVSTYVYGKQSELAGFRVLTSKLGDTFEHGQDTMYIRLDEDPRSVCKLERAPASVPGPGR